MQCLIIARGLTIASWMEGGEESSPASPGVPGAEEDVWPERGYLWFALTPASS